MIRHMYITAGCCKYCTAKGAAVALQCLADASNFISESSKRNTIFKDMFVSGEAYMEDGRRYNLDTLYSHVQQFPKMTGGTRGD